MFFFFQMRTTYVMLSPMGLVHQIRMKHLIILRTVNWHRKNEKLSIKQKLFDDRVGTFVYRRIDFGILILFNYNILHAQHVSLSTRYVNKILRHTKVRVKDPRLGQEHTWYHITIFQAERKGNIYSENPVTSKSK